MPAPLSLETRDTVRELLDCGLSHESIADDLLISRSGVTGLKRHIEKHGHIFPIKPPGKTPTLCEGDYHVVKRIVAEQPDLTLQEYAELISEATGKRLLSAPTICRLLKKLNLRLKKKSPYAEERESEEIKKTA